MRPLSATELHKIQNLRGMDHRVCGLVHGATARLARALTGRRSAPHDATAAAALQITDRLRRGEPPPG